MVTDAEVRPRSTSESAVLSSTENSSLFSRTVSFMITMVAHSRVDPEPNVNGSIVEAVKSLGSVNDMNLIMESSLTTDVV